MFRKFTLAAVAAGALALGSLAPVASAQAAPAGLTSPAVESNVIDVRCWRNRYGHLRCDNRRKWHRAHKQKHCWWSHGVRRCTWR